MARPGPVRSNFFFVLKRLFGPTDPVFSAAAVKILAQKNRANFGSTRFWPGPLLARPSPVRPSRLPPLPSLLSFMIERDYVGRNEISKNNKIFLLFIHRFHKGFLFLPLYKLRDTKVFNFHSFEEHIRGFFIFILFYFFPSFL